MTPVVVRFGPFRLDATKRVLLRDGEPVALTPKAFDALVLLVERRDRVVSKQEFLAALWPDTAVEDGTLSQHVFMVRRALSDSGSEARYVATIARRGYRFIAPVTSIEPVGDSAGADLRPEAKIDSPRRARRLVALIAAICAATGVLTWSALRPNPRARVVHLSLPLSADQRLSRLVRGGPALSPDGRSIAYAANGQLFLRRLDDDDARPIPGTNLDAAMPFFSPDGRWLGFWSAHDSTLKTIAIEGGAPVSVGSASNPRGASWFGRVIVLAEGGEGVVALPASEGDRARWIAPAPDELLRDPHVLPDGDTVLFTAARVTGNLMTRTGVFAYSRATHVRKLVIPHARAARYVGGDAIVYAIGTTLFGARFDRRRLELAGDPIAIAGDASTGADFDASADGSVIYVGGASGDRPRRRLAIVDAGGATHVMPLPVSSYESPRVSPDGTRLAFATEDDGGTIWIGDVADPSRAQRLTFQGRSNFPSGRRTAAASRSDRAVPARSAFSCRRSTRPAPQSASRSCSPALSIIPHRGRPTAARCCS